MVGAFSDEDVTHVEGELDPVRDLAIIHEGAPNYVEILIFISRTPSEG